MTHELAVWLFDHEVGTLSLLDGRLSFSYTPAWLSHHGARSLSASLSLQAQPFDDRLARPYFAGLLPEGQMRRLLAQQFQISAQNDFALLDQIGGECAGAVTLLPLGQTLPMRDGVDQVRWLSDDEVLALLDELPRRPMLAGRDGLRLSLAGAQDKLPVVFDGARIGLPLDGTPSSHILKPAIHAVEESVLNEAFCMALAEAMQLKPARAIVHHVSDRAVLLVERYDRSSGAQARRQRLHQEDFCQALGIIPEMKYQNEGGPDLVKCFELLRAVTRPHAPQVLRLFDYVIFNALLGNHDAHAKNFSLLHVGYNESKPSEPPILAPLYDCLSTAVYSSLTPKMAMKIGSKYKFDEVLARHWEQLAESVGFTKAQAKRRVLELAKALPDTARTLQSDPSRGFATSAVVAQIVALIEQRCALTVRRLNASMSTSNEAEESEASVKLPARKRES